MSMIGNANKNTRQLACAGNFAMIPFFPTPLIHDMPRWFHFSGAKVFFNLLVPRIFLVSPIKIITGIITRTIKHGPFVIYFGIKVH